MTTKKHQSYQYGLEAENYAAQAVEACGMKIICLRFKTPFGEIDIVAQDKEYLVFIEVKARQRVANQDIVSAAKISKICKAADYYLMTNELPQSIPIRFDYVAMEGLKIIDHIVAAWEYPS